MTWAKIPDEFPDMCASVDLSDAAFRTHVEALCWVMRRENGGFITDRDVRRFGESKDVNRAVSELLATGFWRTAVGGYTVMALMEHQPEPEVIRARRRNDATRQRRRRRKAAGLSDEES